MGQPICVRFHHKQKGVHSLKKALNKILNGLLKAENAVSAICSIMMVLLVFVTVVLRYIFKTNIQGMEELIMLIAFGVYFIGAALGGRDETQINADLLSVFLKKKRSLLILRIYQRAVEAVLMGICAVFTAQQMNVVISANSTTTGMKIPMWTYYLLIFIGLVLITFYAVYHCVNYIIELVNLKKDKEGVQE